MSKSTSQKDDRQTVKVILTVEGVLNVAHEMVSQDEGSGHGVWAVHGIPSHVVSGAHEYIDRTLAYWNSGDDVQVMAAETFVRSCVLRANTPCVNYCSTRLPELLDPCEKSHLVTIFVTITSGLVAAMQACAYADYMHDHRDEENSPFKLMMCKLHELGVVEQFLSEPGLFGAAWGDSLTELHEKSAEERSQWRTMFDSMTEREITDPSGKSDLPTNLRLLRDSLN